MNYSFPPSSPYHQLILPEHLLQKLEAMTEDEVKVLLWLHAYARTHGEGALEEEALLSYLQEKGYSADRARNALAYLRGAELICEQSAQKKKKRPAAERAYYTSRQLNQVCEESEEFRALRDYAENKLGKLFNAAELSTLYSFTDSLCFTPAVIMLIIEYCISIEKGSLRYVEKMLCDLSDKGLTQYEAVEAHIANIKEYQSYEGFIRRLCGLGERALTKKEKAIIAQWKNEWSISRELLEQAYEKTIAAIQKPSLDYMSTILHSWHEGGIQTPEQAKNQSPKKSNSFDTDEFFRAAVAKTRGKS